MAVAGIAVAGGAASAADGIAQPVADGVVGVGLARNRVAAARGLAGEAVEVVVAVGKGLGGIDSVGAGGERLDAGDAAGEVDGVLLRVEAGGGFDLADAAIEVEVTGVFVRYRDSTVTPSPFADRAEGFVVSGGEDGGVATGGVKGEAGDAAVGVAGADDVAGGEREGGELAGSMKNQGTNSSTGAAFRAEVAGKARQCWGL